MSRSPKARLEEYVDGLEALPSEAIFLSRLPVLSAEKVERGRQRMALLKSVVPVVRALTEEEAESLLHDGEFPGRLSDLANAAGFSVTDCRTALGHVASTIAGAEPPRNESPCRSDPEARTILDDARRIAADEWRHKYVGSEHLLLALLHDPEELPRLLRAFNLTPDEVREDAVAEMTQLPDPVIAEKLPLTPRLRSVLVLSEAEAVRVGDGELRPRHLLLGLLREGMSPAAERLAARGVTLEALRSAIDG